MSLSDGRLDFDLIVVGGGVFGLSIGWEAGRRGYRTLVIEKDSIPNPVAASFGPSRKIRSTYVDPHYSLLAAEAMQAWRAIEAEVGQELYVATGNLSFTVQDEHPHLDRLEAVLGAAGAQFRVLDEAELRAEFPQIRGARRGLLESQAGFLRASRCVGALRLLAERVGAEIATGQPVEAIEPADVGLKVRSGGRTFHASQVVLAGGGWSKRLVPALSPALRQSQQGLVYLEGVPAAFRWPSFVPFSSLDDGYYGFPAEAGVGLKVAHHSLGEPLDDPDFDRGTTPVGFSEGVGSFLRERLGLVPTDYEARYESCMYNLSRSGDFLLDFYPELPNLFIATAGSGHGFKFGSILGTIVLDRLQGVPSHRWYEHFSFASFLAAQPAPRPL